MKKFKFSDLFKQPENPNMPRPIFLIFLGIVLIVFVVFVFSKKDKNTIKTPTEDNNNPEIVETYDGDNKNKFSFNPMDWIESTKEALSQDVTNYSSPVSSLPEIPRYTEPEDQIYDETLLNVEVGNQNNIFQNEEIPLTNIGRLDPMKPLETSTNKPSIVEEKIKYYSHKDLDKFYSEKSVEISKIPEDQKIEYKTYEQALASGKIPSKEASQRYLSEIQKYELKYGSLDGKIDTNKNETLGYFTGINIEDFVILETGVNSNNLEYVDLYILGGYFYNMTEGEYINGAFYIKEITSNNDIKKSSIVVTFNNEDYLIGYSEEGAKNLIQKIEPK